MSKTILFLEAAAGGGHQSITQAIVESILNLEPQTKIIRLNASPEIVTGGYKIISRQIQFIYTTIYKLTDSQKTRKFLTPLISSGNTTKITQIINKEKPDLIFSDTLFAIDQIPLILKKLNLQIPFCVFVPDPFTPHAVYYTHQAQITFVASIAALQIGLNLGINPHQLILSGHPVRQDFFTTPNLKKLHQKLNLNPQTPSIVLGGSGDGADKTHTILNNLTTFKWNSPLQIIVLTGTNQSMAQNIQKIDFPPNLKVEVLSSISNVADYLHIARFVAAKAGPNILFETIAAGKPFLATHHVEGQENGNLEFIKSTQVGFIDENPASAARLIYKLIHTPELLAITQPNIDFIRSQLKVTSLNIANHTLALLNSSTQQKILS